MNIYRPTDETPALPEELTQKEGSGTAFAVRSDGILVTCTTSSSKRPRSRLTWTANSIRPRC